MRSILFFGHSILVHLFEFLCNNIDERCKLEFNLKEEVEIVKKCYSGLSFKKMSKICGGSIENMVDNRSYDIIILQFGGNDFKRFKDRPVKMAKKLVKLAKSLKKLCNAKKIIICNILPRIAGNKSYSLSTKKAAKYRNWRREVNRNTKLLASNKIIIWNHQQLFRNNKLTIFLKDGTHLNRYGNFLLYKSLRGAILYALNNL